MGNKLKWIEKFITDPLRKVGGLCDALKTVETIMLYNEVRLH